MPHVGLAERDAIRMADSEHCALNSELALVDSRCGELLARLREDSPKWLRARSSLALESGDKAATNRGANAMDEASARLSRNDKTWRQVQSWSSCGGSWPRASRGGRRGWGRT